MEVIDKIVELIVVWLPIVTSAVGSFALIATVTPNKVDDEIVNVLLKIINFLGANIGKAANKDE